MWPVRSIIIGLISFFVANEGTVGSIERSHSERMKIAKESKDKILKNKNFIEIFETMKDNIGLGKIPEKKTGETINNKNNIEENKETSNNNTDI